MAKLSLKTQNTKGGSPLWKERLGYTASFLDGKGGNRIICDAYIGEDSQRREREEVNIELWHRDELIFEGSYNMLISILVSDKIKNN